MHSEHLAHLAALSSRMEDRCGVRAAAYRAIADRAGATFRCLDPEGEEEPPPTTAVEDGGDGAVTVRIQGPLDWWFGFDYRAVIADLDKAQPTSIHLLIESPGGFLSDGLALYSDLRSRVREGATITSEARGVVASAAVLPFVAADTRGMPTGTELMVHDPWSWVFEMGTVAEMRPQVEKTFKALKAGERTLREVMVERSSKSLKKISQWLQDETWFSPTEAVDAGLATEIIADHATTDDAPSQALARRLLAAWRLNLRRVP